jgi:hypothetical protein
MKNVPGFELIYKGIEDLKKGLLTVESLLVLIGLPKLKSLGLNIPEYSVDQPEHKLYELLSTNGDDAHSKYNSLIRRLVSFERSFHASAHQ